jgi:galactose mutarotase-like enzyme
MSNQKSPWVLIGSDELSAGIDPLGAQLSMLRDRSGRDLLWNGDPSVWSGRAPLLFPIVGALAGGIYRLGSKAYPLSRHGFARGSVFEVASASRAGALFRLQADAASLQVYPFRFQLEIEFAIDGPILALTARIRNLGREDMPASFGYHPAFRWPLPYGQARAAHFIEFEAPEPAPVRRLDAGGLLTPEHHPSPIIDRRLALDDTLFEDDVIIFDSLRSRSVEYGADDGPRLRVSFADAPFLGVWTKPRAEFICIEPWHGVADPQAYAGEFRAKPGVFNVARGSATAIRMEITLLSV